jgi:hypothetical protein
VPAQVAGLSGVSAVAVSEEFACALTEGGGVLCWGNQLGDNCETCSSVPAQVAGLTSGVTAIAVRAYDPVACAAIQGGQLVCWGGRSLVPQAFPGPASTVTALAMGDSFICALTVDGAAECWGGVCASPADSPLCATTPTVVTGL